VWHRGKKAIQHSLQTKLGKGLSAIGSKIDKSWQKAQLVLMAVAVPAYLVCGKRRGDNLKKSEGFKNVREGIPWRALGKPRRGWGPDWEQEEKVSKRRTARTVGRKEKRGGEVRMKGRDWRLRRLKREQQHRGGGGFKGDCVLERKLQPRVHQSGVRLKQGDSYQVQSGGSGHISGKGRNGKLSVVSVLFSASLNLTGKRTRTDPNQKASTCRNS